MNTPTKDELKKLRRLSRAYHKFQDHLVNFYFDRAIYSASLEELEALRQTLYQPEYRATWPSPTPDDPKFVSGEWMLGYVQFLIGRQIRTLKERKE